MTGSSRQPRLRGRLLAAVAGLALLAAAPPPAAGADAGERAPIRLALTFDDLPWVGPPPADGSPAAAIERMAATLRVHGAPATGFVVCDRAADDRQPLATWAAWGLALGNHTASHPDLDATPVDAWLADVDRCRRFLAELGDAVTPTIRFPRLHQGRTRETRDAVARALAERGLATAHVTVDTSDWILARAHAHALATGDAALRLETGRELVRHVLAAVEHAEAVARRKTGRGVPHVLLLHANSLVEDHLDALLLALGRRGVEWVSLSEALEDPVYALADGYAGPQGLSWLYRMEPATPEDAAFDDAEAAAIERRFAAALAGEPGAGAGSPLASLSVAAGAPPALRRVALEAGASERMRSLVVMHRGEVVLEATYHGAGPETPVNLKSITKTLTSALVGVALRRGWIRDLDDPLSRYLPERFGPGAPKANGEVTLRQLLTMSSGLPPVDYGAVQASDDWLTAILSRPVDPQARGRFVYDTPVLQLLTAVLERASGLPADQLARRELLTPLGAELAFWRADARGLPLGGNDAYLTPRDLALLGELYRRGGTFGGRRLLGEELVRESTSVQVVPPERTVNHDTLPVRGYGYLWWLPELPPGDLYAALGHGGQVLLVAPADELVVVATSRWPAASSAEHYRHLARVIVEGVLPVFRRGG